ncbi:hypothetical protein AAHE18_10G133800 [Arachis hypogaea]
MAKIPEKRAVRPSCWTSLTPTITSPRRRGRVICGGGETWMDQDPVWKVSTGRREGTEVGFDSPLSCMWTLMRSSRWVEQPATFEAISPSTKPLTPMILWLCKIDELGLVYIRMKRMD